jgi:hypothetical protein
MSDSSTTVPMAWPSQGTSRLRLRSRSNAKPSPGPARRRRAAVAARVAGEHPALGVERAGLGDVGIDAQRGEHVDGRLPHAEVQGRAAHLGDAVGHLEVAHHLLNAKAS